MIQSVIGSFYWDPPREAFTIPFFNHPIVWYSLFFVSGFILSYFAMIAIFKRFLSSSSSLSAFPPSIQTTRQGAFFLTDRLSWFVVAGTVIGSRLGEVFFYDWAYFRDHPSEIFKVWHGGLASHGGVIGILIALFLYFKSIQKWIPQLSFLRLLDFVAIPSPLGACFIRLGNFMNQEIIGTPTDMPWGVVFGHPADHATSVARHPVQLYEAFAYLLTFFLLWSLWKKQPIQAKGGFLVGWMFICIFASRFMIEFWKAEQQSFIFSNSFLQTGQILSIPFILLGIVLVCVSKKKNSIKNEATINNL